MVFSISCIHSVAEFSMLELAPCTRHALSYRANHPLQPCLQPPPPPPSPLSPPFLPWNSSKQAAGFSLESWPVLRTSSLNTSVSYNRWTSAPLLYSSHRNDVFSANLIVAACHLCLCPVTLHSLLQVSVADFSGYLSRLSTPRELMIMMTEMFARIEAKPNDQLKAEDMEFAVSKALEQAV